MQHGRARTALSARGFAGRSRAMSVLMALCLFAAIALAIPGFTARADSNDGPYSIPNTSFIVSLENASTLRRSTARRVTGASSSIMAA